MPTDENASVLPAFYQTPATYYDRKTHKEVAHIFHPEHIGQVMVHVQSDSGVLTNAATRAILGHNALQSALSAAITEAGEMRKALERYAEHDDDCPSVEFESSAYCTCGLAKSLEAAGL